MHGTACKEITFEGLMADIVLRLCGAKITSPFCVFPWLPLSFKHMSLLRVIIFYLRHRRRLDCWWRVSEYTHFEKVFAFSSVWISDPFLRRRN